MRAFVLFLMILGSGLEIHADDKPIKVFVLAGQSNMVGWGDSTKLPETMQRGHNRILMFENDKWQPLKPFVKAKPNQQKVGLTEFAFGPEIGFAHELSKAWPDETIGIVKLAVGGTSILTWKPEWSKDDADRVGQGRLGSLFKKLIAKVKQAEKSRNIQIVGFLWLQGGGDMKNVDVAKEYLKNLKSLVAGVRKSTSQPQLPVLCGSVRRDQDPDDLSALVPQKRTGRYPAVEWVVKAQWNGQKEIKAFHTVILREIPTHPRNVHYNTVGQLEVGKLFAKRFLSLPSIKRGRE